MYTNLVHFFLQVTLKGAMKQKMPYFAYCNDAQHLVCLPRNRIYVNLMNVESSECITTGEDPFLNSLLVSGDGRYLHNQMLIRSFNFLMQYFVHNRILVCGDETPKLFPLLVWHLS